LVDYRLAIAIALAVLCGVASTVRAQDSERVEWRPQWREVQPVEYGAALGLGLGTLAI
jgi:hypothetical protein